MQGPNTSTKSFKQAFLKNLLLGLQLHARTSTSFGSSAMNLHERKLAVKFYANVAMAAARCATRTDARWPSAILASEAGASPSSGACKMQRCRTIVSRCCRRKRSWIRSGRAGAGAVARRLLRTRTMALRDVIPGGRDAAVDQATLLREAMDYAVHLRAQVDVLRHLSEAVQRSSSISRQGQQ
ncbi:transcription factor IBH1-like 1 [Aegilops tauschii subsp. strangulata]|uniref:IBH1-like N-terminal domain-containing protein n=1 Tax=Aegilops tauschii TaxID=37682 RepID=M8AL23_AEGTA|nr:transcription factor IBH1-like 1 [Aegilops tauschii subsp. strangulata]